MLLIARKRQDLEVLPAGNDLHGCSASEGASRCPTANVPSLRDFYVLASLPRGYAPLALCGITRRARGTRRDCGVRPETAAMAAELAPSVDRLANFCDGDGHEERESMRKQGWASFAQAPSICLRANE